MRRAALVLAFVLTGCAPAASTASPTPGTSPTAAATPTASPTPAPSASGSLRPNPTAGPGTYTNIALAYRVTIPAGWHRSACVSGTSLGGVTTEVFFRGDPAEEAGTDTGFLQDTMSVQAQPANGMTPIQWVESGKMGYFGGSHFARTTFDGKDAAAMVADDTGKVAAYAVAARDRMYTLASGFRQPTAATQAELEAFMASFHILSDAELADARTTIATPSPAPQRTPEDVADVVAKGFAMKDIAVLASVAASCLMHGREQAGAGFRATGPVLADMQRSFANGLSVALQARPIVDRTADYAAIQGTWTDPNGTQNGVKMTMFLKDGTWTWTGWLDLAPVR